MISRKTIERFAFIAAFASVLLFSGVVDAVAQVQNLSRQVEGAGPSRNAAIQNALIEATRQLYGVSIQSVTSSESHSVVGMSETDGAAIDQTFYVDSLNRSIREQIGGPGKRPYISGYELLDVEEDDAGQFVATIEVGYTKYKVPGPANNRRRLAFYGVTVDSDTVQNFVLADKAAVQIGDRFEEVMVQSRRFAMLERSGHDVVGTEKVYLKYHGASNAELARFGQTMGADYIVYGIVTSASFSQNAKTIEVTGQTIHSGTAKLEIAYKVVAVATHQIKWSTRLKETTSWRGQKGVGGVRTQLAEKLAQKMADNLLENIFPPKL
ncbi:MAG: CsgG/HfaB family protein, partial [Alphaproteobacteria bacterium]